MRMVSGIARSVSNYMGGSEAGAHSASSGPRRSRLAQNTRAHDAGDDVYG